MRSPPLSLRHPADPTCEFVADRFMCTMQRMEPARLWTSCLGRRGRGQSLFQQGNQTSEPAAGEDHG